MQCVPAKSFRGRVRRALARAAGSAVAVCALTSCFLDESPRTGASSTSSSAGSDRTDGGKRSFVPRDPGAIRSQGVDAAAPAPGSTDSTASIDDKTDAAVPSVTPPSDAQVAMQADAQVVPSGPGSVMDAGPSAPGVFVDAQVAPVADAAAPAVDAQAAPDTGPQLPAALPQPIHRYEFEGAARVAVDSIGDAHGELQGRAYLGGNGSVQLGGMYEDAVVLPPRILSGLTHFTMLGWMVPRTRECTQRLFEFIYYREGQQRAQVSALYLAPYACPDNVPAVGYLTERAHHNVASEQPLAGPREQALLGAMYDATTEELALIVDGEIVQRMTVPLQQRELAFAQGSLGRSSPQGDSAFGATIAEFRIYDQTLDAATLAEIARRGPDEL